MAREQRSIPFNGNKEQASNIITRILENNGYKYTQQRDGQLIWSKAVNKGASTKIKATLNGNGTRIEIEAWASDLGGLVEYGLDGFVLALPKRRCKAVVDEICDTISRLLPPSPPRQTNTATSNRTGAQSSNAKYNELYNSLKAKAENGDVQSMKLLGDLIYQGPDSNQKNGDAAFPWWKMAADHGDTSLYFKVGATLLARADYTDERRGCAQAREAIPYLKAAAEQGHIGACMYLGMAYDTGLFGEPDYIMAEKYCLPAARKGDVNAIERLVHVLAMKHEADRMYDWIIAGMLNGHAKLKQQYDEMYRDGSMSFRRDMDRRVKIIRQNGNIPPNA